MALWSLAYKNDANRAAIAEAGGLQLLVQVRDRRAAAAPSPKPGASSLGRLGCFVAWASFLSS
jgi:hypothetical protein